MVFLVTGLFITRSLMVDIPGDTLNILNSVKRCNDTLSVSTDDLDEVELIQFKLTHPEIKVELF